MELWEIRIYQRNTADNIIYNDKCVLSHLWVKMLLKTVYIVDISDFLFSFYDYK